MFLLCDSLPEYFYTTPQPCSLLVSLFLHEPKHCFHLLGWYHMVVLWYIMCLMLNFFHSVNLYFTLKCDFLYVSSVPFLWDDVCCIWLAHFMIILKVLSEFQVPVFILWWVMAPTVTYTDTIFYYIDKLFYFYWGDVQFIGGLERMLSWLNFFNGFLQLLYTEE